jgi:hypothetical protein
MQKKQKKGFAKFYKFPATLTRHPIAWKKNCMHADVPSWPAPCMRKRHETKN